jgi:hypothetical protein
LGEVRAQAGSGVCEEGVYCGRQSDNHLGFSATNTATSSIRRAAQGSLVELSRRYNTCCALGARKRQVTHQQCVPHRIIREAKCHLHKAIFTHRGLGRHGIAGVGTRILPCEPGLLHFPPNPRPATAGISKAGSALCSTSNTAAQQHYRPNRKFYRPFSLPRNGNNSHL